ncbi:MAG: pyridoxamine 5'-phosphate oxidase family protein [Acidobacteriota bacterium]|jgi:hypothetical protein
MSGTTPSSWGEVLDRAFRRGRFVLLVVTADEAGLPHVGKADGLKPGKEGRLQISGWLCATTVRNLKRNPRLTVVVQAEPEGVQLAGRLESLQEDAMLDGYADGTRRMPQVRWRLTLRPTQLMRFREGEHADEVVEL